MRVTALLLLLTIAGCAAAAGPAGQASMTNVNPITGSRGGTSAGASR